MAESCRLENCIEVGVRSVCLAGRRHVSWPGRLLEGVTVLTVLVRLVYVAQIENRNSLKSLLVSTVSSR